MRPNNEQLVRARAYQIWEREGGPEGRDKEHWYQATRELQTPKTVEDPEVVDEVVRVGPLPASIAAGSIKPLQDQTNGPRG